MDELQIAAVNDKPRRIGIGLYDVAQLRVGVFQAGWRMLLN